MSDDDQRASGDSVEPVVGMAASPRFRPYDDGLKKRLSQLSRAFYGCQLAFGAAIDADQQSGPAEGSQADLERRYFARHDPPYPPTALALVPFQSYFYVSAAAEHMRGLGALYDKQEVLIPPPALIRCVLEHSARVVWLLGDDLQPEDRLARAYLEQLFSAIEQKKTTGRLLGKRSQGYLADAKALADLRQEASGVFGASVVDEQGEHRIRGQRRPGLEDCVAAMFQRLHPDTSLPDQRGIYDYVSNISHPTVYPHIEMWQVIEVDGEKTFTSAITAEDHDRRASMAIGPFCEALNHLISYQGWNREPYDQLREALDRLLQDPAGP